jgi:hypothetical protein
MSILSRLFGKKASKPLSPVLRVIAPFPEDYAAEVKTMIELIQSYSDETTEEEIESVNEFYFNTIDWINQNEDLNLDSFYDLIVAIMKYMRSEVSTDQGNDFRLDHELYTEGVQDKSFFLDPKNEPFLLRIVALGPEADHFLCCLLSELRSRLSQSFIDLSFEIVTKRSTLNNCEHIQDWPAKYNINSDVEVSGNVIAEFIQSDRLSESQIAKVIKFLNKIGKQLEQWQIDTCNFHLAQCSVTPSDYLKTLSKNHTSLFGWVKEDNGDWDFIEISISELAQKNLEARKSIAE